MLIQQQPNRHSCVLTAFATVLDINQDLLIQDLGHDGSKIIFPDLPEPYRRRGFDPREFVYWAAERNIAIIQLDKYLIREHVLRDILDMQDKMEKIMIGKIGVITGVIGGIYHALAWDGVQAIGSITEEMDIDCFYWVKK